MAGGPGSDLGVRRRSRSPCRGRVSCFRRWRSIRAARRRTTTSPRHSTTAWRVVARGQVTIKPFGLVGHQTVGGMWSNKAASRSSRIPPISRAASARGAVPSARGSRARSSAGSSSGSSRGLLVPARPANREDSTWTVFYGFDQYFWHPGGDQKRGIGMFFNFGASDGEGEPDQVQLQRAGSAARGLCRGARTTPSGSGWARTELSDNFVPFLRQQLDLGLDQGGRGRDVLQRLSSRGGST